MPECQHGQFQRVETKEPHIDQRIAGAKCCVARVADNWNSNEKNQHEMVRAMINRKAILLAATCFATMYGVSTASANDSAVMQSQVNAPNGVAGLDGDKNLILGQGTDTTKTRSVHFAPGNNNITNTDVYIWCDRGTGTDHQGHCHFDNMRYGNTWEMNNSLNVYNKLRTGTVQATSNLTIGKTDTSASDEASPPKIEFPSTTDPYVVADTLMAGGHDAADRVFSKWTCFNISGGDQGGACQNFGDHTGHESNYRNGAGLQDGINVSTQIDNSSSLDVIGGGRKSADGVIYTVSYTPGSVIIKPALSKKELSLLRFQMRIWTNMTDGSFETTSSGSNPNARNTQVPSYYIGYWNGENKTNATSTELTVTTYWVQGAPESKFGWYRTGSLKDGLFPAAAKAPGENAGDIIDGKLAGTDPAHTTGLTANAIYLGGPDQVFNNYTLEVYNPNSDSRVSSYDNEFDHWMKTTADNQVVSRGATYVWMGSNAHRLATGSWMMRLAGALVQPVGLWIDGVYPGGYLLKSDDAFVNFSHQGPMAYDIGASQFATGLGQAVADNQNWGRLAYFASRDGLANSSFHLGMSRSGGTQGQQDSVDCGGNCVQQGQLIFDPLGYRGGIGLGVGQGKNTQTPVVVDGAGYTHIQKSLDTVIKLSKEHTLQASDCGSTLLTGTKVTTDHDLPVGCKVTIIPTADNLSIAGGAWTVMNWAGGGGPSPTYNVDKAYREITLRVVDDNWGQKYYTLVAH